MRGQLDPVLSFKDEHKSEQQCSNLTVVHSSNTSKNCPQRVGFFATSPVDE